MHMPLTHPMSILTFQEKAGEGMELLYEAAEHAGALCQILTCGLLLIKPVREWLMGTEALKEGQRCLLRSEIVRLYYRHVKDKQLQEYEYRNLVQCYEGYRALKGNSFVEHIYQEMQEWEIV